MKKIFAWALIVVQTLGAISAVYLTGKERKKITSTEASITVALHAGLAAGIWKWFIKDN